MNGIIKKPELLAPAGDRECLEAALLYGADAVYLGGQLFSMRTASKNFDAAGLKAAVQSAHARGVRVYYTMNTTPLNEEADWLEEYLKEVADAGVDAFIVADIGVLMAARRVAGVVDLHISTQAGITNYLTAREFWHLGARRVVLARELSLADIAAIRQNTPPELELECFVHGAVCLSFSGRCLLSQYMIGRDANRGECAQPCRWKYHLMEEKRHGQYYPVEEDENGSYILNAKDICMLEHLDKLAAAGVGSLKIEGRAKAAYYVGVVTNAYRQALDIWASDPNHYRCPDWLREEVGKVSHRAYDTGFYFGTPKDGQYTLDGGYIRDWEVAGVVDGYDVMAGRLLVSQRNRFFVGDTLEAVLPDGPPVPLVVRGLFDEEGNAVEAAPHPMQKLQIAFDRPLPAGVLLRRPKADEKA